MPEPLPLRLLTALAADGAAPRLTWYGPDGERTELSGRVLANWVTKVANLLLEEGDAGPGTRVLVDLPVHWRSLVWVLGSWTAGAEVVLAEEGRAGDDAEVVVTSRPDRADADLVLAVALPALAMRWDGPDLPAGVVDAAAELMTYGDQLGFAPAPADGDVALDGEPPVLHGELGQWSAGAAGQVGAAEGARVLIRPDTLRELLSRAVGLWQAGGSVVLLGPDVPESEVEQVAQVERADVR